jgi:hypothetical protein
VDYTLPQRGSLTFAPGETSHSLGIELTDDGLLEPAETLGLALSPPPNANLASPVAFTLTIQDNEPRIVFLPVVLRETVVQR